MYFLVSFTELSVHGFPHEQMVKIPHPLQESLHTQNTYHDARHKTTRYYMYVSIHPQVMQCKVTMFSFTVFPWGLSFPKPHPPTTPHPRL